MSEPITPKADRHVVEGEFVESEVNAKTQPLKPKAAWLSRDKNLWLWVVVMSVSGIAFALALVAWLNLQPLLNQQQSVQQFEQQLVLLQQQLQQTHTLQQDQQQQLAEMQQAWQMLIQHNDNTEMQTAPQDSTESSANLNQLQGELEAMQQQLNSELSQLHEKLAGLSGSAQQAIDAIDSEQLNAQLQALDAQLQQQLLQLNQQLTNLAQQQSQFAEQIAPKVEEIVSEIRPGLEGIMSRFNQLFSIKKHAPEQAESQP